MDLLLKFKDYLTQGKDQPSKITIKNYIADLRKFIRWYETTYERLFHPLAISPAIIEEYKNQIRDARSLKRYLSSLRKFFQYLHALGAIPSNPLDQAIIQKEQDSNPWRLKDFKSFLYNTKASKLTIKNYIIDIRQFLEWLKEVIATEARYENITRSISESEVYSRIDQRSIEEYKNRLLSERKLSPVSINRKLSSLRRYVSWLNEKKIIQTEIPINDLRAVLAKEISTSIEPTQEITPPEVSLEDLKELATLGAKEEKQVVYSKFPPLRLIQKSTRGITLLLDVLILLPIIRMITSGKYAFWKISGRKIFAPANEIFNASLKDIGSEIAATPLINLASETIKTSNGMTATARSLSILSKLTGLSKPSKLPNVANLPKTMYAPLKISTKNLSLQKKIIYHLRHTRPEWYKKYHSYPIVHYFHLSIFLIATTTVGFGLYQSFFDSPRSQKPVLAAVPNAPPRILSFQGRLTDSTDTPITAATSLRFAIYNNESASGSALLWQEELQITPDQDGVFATLLGKKSAISQSLFSENPSLYLGVTVGADNELQPRQQLATVAFAANAETLQGLVPITQADAGTTNVVLALDSAGNLTMGNNASPTFIATGGTFTLSGKTLSLTTVEGSDGNIELAPDGNGVIDLQRPIENTKGNVDVHDVFTISANTVTQAGFSINQNGSGSIISASSGGTAKFSVDYTGAGTFADTLTVNGTALKTSSPTFNLLNTTVTNLNFAGATTALSIASAAGTTTVNNALTVIGLLSANGGATIPGTKNLTVLGTINSHLMPASSGTYDIGAFGSYWREAFLVNLFMSPSATTSGFWQRNNGALAPTNISDDILVGGTTPTAAKFHIFSATGNATTAGTLTFNTTGNIQTTNNQTLTLGGTTTGNILLQPLNGTGRVGIGLANPLATLDINGSASASGNLTFNSAGVIQTVKNQTLTIGGNSTGNILLQPLNGSGNVGIGTGTPLARLDVNGSASISGNLTFNSAGNIQTVANQTLTIGGSTTGNILLQPLNGSGNVGIGTATPLARLDVNGSASISGNLTFNSAGNIQTTANQALTIGGSTTGNILLLPQNGTGMVGIGTIVPLATIDIRGAIGTKAVASISGQTSFAALTVNNSGSGDLFTASSSGITKIRIDTNGNILPGANGTQNIGSSSLNWDTVYANNVIAGSLSGIQGFWQRNGSALSPYNINDDILLGSTSTSSAKIALMNIAGGTPTASISANNGNNAVYLTGTGNLGTTNGQTLTLGGATTGDIILSPANGSGIVTSTGTLNLSGGKTYQIAGADVLSATTLGSGVTGSSLTSVSTITSGTWNATIINTQYGGTGQDFSSVAQGSIPYFSNTGIMTTLATGTTGQCLITNGPAANPSWVNCASGASSWTSTNGAIYPTQNTIDFLLGSNATSSAKFGFINVADGTPTASISANNGNNAVYLTGLGNLGTTNGQTLTLGGATTGDILLNSGSGNITLANATSFLNNTTFSGLATFNTGATIASGQNLTLESFTGNNAVLYGTVTTGVVASATTNTGSLCLISGGSAPSWSACPGSGSGSSKWTEDGSGVLYPNNPALDFLLGGASSSSAKFAVLNIADSTFTPIASISAIGGANAGNGISLSGDSSIQSLSNSSLTLGGNTTGDIKFSPGGMNNAVTFASNGNVAIGPIAPTNLLNMYSASADAILYSGTGGSANTAGMYLDRAGTSGFAGQYYLSGGTEQWQVGLRAGDDSLHFRTADTTDTMVIATNGDITITGSGGTCTMTGAATTTTCGSDAKLKTNVQNLDNSLAKIMDLRPVTYNWIDPNLDQSTQIGFIAQEVQQIFPNFVAKMNNGNLGVRYESFIMPTIKAIQELNIKVDTAGNIYESELEKLRQEIATVPAAPETDTSIQTLLISLISRVASLEGQLANNTNSMTTKDATISGTLRTDRLIAGSIDGLDDKLATLAAALGQQNTPIYNSTSSSSANLNDENVQSASGSATQAYTSNNNLSIPGYTYLQTNFANLASLSGQLTTLTADLGTFKEGIISMGPTSLTDAAVSNQLAIGSSMMIADNSINTFGEDLHIQPFKQGLISFMDDAVIITTDGDLNVNGNAVFAKDVTVKGKLAAHVISPVPDEDLIIQLSETADGKHNKFEVQNASGSSVLSVNHLGDLIASGSGKFSNIATGALNIVRGVQADTSVTESVASSSAGTAMINAHQNERTIYSPYVKANSLIYVTATSNTQGQVPYVARQTAENEKTKTKGSFTVQIPTNVAKDIKFNWWIVN